MSGEQPNQIPARIGAVVLAGGESARMGQPKALLPFGTRRLLDLALAAVALPEIDRTVLVLGAHEEAVRDAMWLDEVETVRNIEWRGGMITSVKAGVLELSDWADFIVLMPCDYALVESATVARLLLRAVQTRAPIVAPGFYGRSGHPIVLARETFEPVLRLDESLGLDSAVQAFKPQRELVEVNDPAVHFDIDTPEDYETALKAWDARQRSREEYVAALKR